MPYRLTRFDGNAHVTLSDNALLDGTPNVSSDLQISETPISFIGRNKPNFGLFHNQNFLWLSENFSSDHNLDEHGVVIPRLSIIKDGNDNIISTETELNPGPSRALRGQTWYNPESLQLNLCVKEGVTGLVLNGVETRASEDWMWARIPSVIQSTEDPSDSGFVPNQDNGMLQLTDSHAGSIWLNPEDQSINIHDGKQYQVVSSFDVSTVRRGAVLPIIGLVPNVDGEVVKFIPTSGKTNIALYGVNPTSITRYNFSVMSKISENFSLNQELQVAGFRGSSTLECFVVSDPSNGNIKFIDRDGDRYPSHTQEFVLMATFHNKPVEVLVSVIIRGTNIVVQAEVKDNDWDTNILGNILPYYLSFTVVMDLETV